MKERLLDVIKWGLIIVIAAIAFYIVYPKYYFGDTGGKINSRGNKITGGVELLWDGKWERIGKNKNYTTVRQETKRQSLSPKRQKTIKGLKRKKKS